MEIAIILLVVLIGLVVGDLALVRALKRRSEVRQRERGEHRDDRER